MKAKWCETIQTWICFGDPDLRVRRRDIASNIVQYYKTGKAAYIQLASLSCKNQEDTDFFNFVWDFLA